MAIQSFLASATSTTGGALAVSLLLFVGGFTGLKALYRLASSIYVYALRPGKPLKKLGQWAVVTGSTDGIGRAYADALAKIGELLLFPEMRPRTPFQARVKYEPVKALKGMQFGSQLECTMKENIF